MGKGMLTPKNKQHFSLGTLANTIELPLKTWCNSIGQPCGRIIKIHNPGMWWKLWVVV
jgi:hypothetical protein